MLAKKIIFSPLILILILALGPSSALAQSDSNSIATSSLVEQIVSQTQQVDNLVQVTEQDFGNIKTGWLNNLWRDVKIIFTFDPVKKADLELEKATAVLLRTKKDILNENGETDSNKLKEKLERAFQKYDKAMGKVKASLEKYKQSHPDDQRLEKFLDKFSDFNFKHQMVFKSLENKTPEQIKKLVEQRRQEQLKGFMETMGKVENGTKLKLRFKKMLLDEQPKFEYRVMRARLLEEAEKLDLDEQTKEKIEELKNEVKPLWEELHQAYEEAAKKRQEKIEALKKEAEEKKDELMNNPEVRREFVQKVNKEMKSLREENRKIYKEKKEKVDQFIEEHKDDLLEIKDEVSPLLKNKRQEQIQHRVEVKTKTQVKPKMQIQPQDKLIEDPIQVRTQVKNQINTQFHKINNSDE